MEKSVEALKDGAGALAEMIGIFYTALLQQGFTSEQALILTRDYMKAVFGK